ncbi:MAG: PQQ-binding-like beta-propeller repeat protein [Planctomycetota bacterium]|nr:PQQ-binding-like beta-propeller repeat protein [Planctomycetota bacterium]
MRSNIDKVSGFLFVFLIGTYADAGDWPQWRYDGGRTAASPAELPDQLHLAWVTHYSARTPVWDDPLNQDLMPYDEIFEPVVLGKTMFIGFNDSDKVVALDTETGEEKWSFYTNGPVRLPPAASGGKVFVVSDDGFLYCLNAGSGELVWKYRGGPADRKIIGNKRLISTWPARGGPVVMDGTVYFAAGIWPFMGTFIYALEAETGRVQWLNDSNGSEYMLQPHNSAAFAGVAPQGALVAVDDKLLVPGGRSVPACFDRRTGKYLYYHLAKNGKTGGSFVCAKGNIFFNHFRDQMTNMYFLSDGSGPKHRVGQHPVLTEKTIYLAGKSSDLSGYREGNTLAAVNGEQIQADSGTWQQNQQWEIAADASGDLIKAGNRLYAAGGNHITAIEIPAEGGAPRTVWTKDAGERIARLLAADGKLFAVTSSGKIMAFSGTAESQTYTYHTPAIVNPPADLSGKVKSIIEETGVSEGYALFYGLGDGRLLEALACKSKLQIIAVDPDAEKVEGLRRRFDLAGLYGTRISVHQGDAISFQTPLYMSSLSVVHDLTSAGYDQGEVFISRLFRSLRPYGGVAWLPMSKEQGTAFTAQVSKALLPGSKVLTFEPPPPPGPDAKKPKLPPPPKVLKAGSTLLVREGSLPGSSPWTHQYGNISNTVKSDDSRVKLPLGILWFGGSSNKDILPRHGHGPPEQVIGGRLFIEGMTSLSARDVYTGRVLWERVLDNLGNKGKYFDDTYKDTPTDIAYNQVHIPGANVRGTNYVATPEHLYIIQGGECHVLDTATGGTLKVISLPKLRDSENPQWGYIGIYGDYLIAGADFAEFSELLPEDKKEKGSFTDYDTSASKSLVVMDRHTGKVHWTFQSRNGLIHNAIAVGNDTIYCLDRHPPYIEKRMKRRGFFFDYKKYRLLALDIRTGKIRWQQGKDVFGTWLSYSEQYDILLQATRPSRDMVREEGVPRMITYRADKGTVLWDKSFGYGGPPILHGETIITDGAAYSLLEGIKKTRTHPITGEKSDWTFSREYGCNYAIASEHLISFRSAAAGFYDLTNDGGTGNLGGFKSSCTSNLIAADGVLNAPDYTRTCSCSYQNQTSLALVHDPDVELWSFNELRSKGGPVKRVGINFGAPGDRLTEDGTLWLEAPFAGGPSPNVPVQVEPGTAQFFRHHVSKMQGEGLKWVAASGVIGADEITVSVVPRSLVIVPPTKFPPVIDGKLDDATWKNAKPIPFEGNLHSRVPATTVFMCRDEQAVYFAYHRKSPVVDGSPVPLVAKFPMPDTPCWRDDEVEIFLSDAGRQVGLQFAMSCAGGSFRGRNALPKRGWSDVNWRGEWKYAVSKQPDQWSVEASFPLNTLRDEGIDPAKLHINIMSQNLSGVGASNIYLVNPGPLGFGRCQEYLAAGDNQPDVPQSLYTVRLHFAETEGSQPGERVFGVAVQGKEVLKNFDIASEAGGQNRPLVKEFTAIEITSELSVSFTQSPGKAPPLINGIELIAE